MNLVDGFVRKSSAPKISDMIAMEIEVKGLTEPFRVRLDPCAVVVPGMLFMGTTTRVKVKVESSTDAFTFACLFVSKATHCRPPGRH